MERVKFNCFFFHYQLQGHLHDTLLDQLPPLAELQTFLCSLAVAGNQTSRQKTNLVLEELPEIKDNLIKEAERFGGYLAIAQNQSDTFLTTSKEKICSVAQRLNSAYNTDLLAEMEANEQKATSSASKEKRCGVCDKEAEKKCSKCKQIFYCSR